MPEKVLTVTEQTHATVNAWCAANGRMNQDFVVARALDALKLAPNGLIVPVESTEPQRDVPRA